MCLSVRSFSHQQLSIPYVCAACFHEGSLHFVLCGKAGECSRQGRVGVGAECMSLFTEVFHHVKSSWIPSNTVS